jgi:serine/threonine protein kinase
MCTGKVPFKDKTRTRTIELIKKGVHEEIPPEKYSKELRNLVNAMLNVESDLRPNIDEIL